MLLVVQAPSFHADNSRHTAQLLRIRIGLLRHCRHCRVLRAKGGFPLGTVRTVQLPLRTRVCEVEFATLEAAGRWVYSCGSTASL
jgi:hypothetical protein